MNEETNDHSLWKKQYYQTPFYNSPFDCQVDLIPETSGFREISKMLCTVIE